MKEHDLNAILTCRLEDVLKGAKLAEGDIRRVTTVVNEEGKTTVHIEETMQLTRTSDGETLRGKRKTMIDAFVDRLRQRSAGRSKVSQNWEIQADASGDFETDHERDVLSTIDDVGVRETA